MILNEKLLSTPKLFSRENDIIEWGNSRNIIGDTAQGSFEGQQEKTRQEWQEWKENHTRDDIGDIVVTLVMQCALKGTTISEILENNKDINPISGTDYGAIKLSCNKFLDDSIEDLLNEPDTFEINIIYVIAALGVCCAQYEYDFDECIEVAWNDIKDRKGVMCHGTFVKQTNIDSLLEVGVEFDNELQAFTGTCFFMKELLTACTTFDSLGFTFEQSGTITTGIKLKTTGSN